VINILKKYIPTVPKLKSKKVLTQISSIGAKYRCSVCGSHVKSFLLLPEFYTENLQKHGWRYSFAESETLNYQYYLCPFCSSSDRDRLYALYLQDYLKVIKAHGPFKIVDFAPSPPLSLFIRKLIKTLRQEIIYRTVDLCAEGVDDKVDITDMRLYKDNQFDFLICSHVLEHVEDDRKALNELHRILKPGGQGIIMVPVILSIEKIDEDPAVVNVAERWRRFGQFDHVRLYSKSGFVKRVREAGFLVNQYGKEFFGEELFARTGITSQSILYVVKK